jgi:lipopolysaccharide cholinephosphotransferase
MDEIIDIKSIHNELLDTLFDIDQSCRKHDIKYSLYAGTLIGAIRHKGFIPWDNDADIIFSRKEYEKFIVLYKEEKKDQMIIDDDFRVLRIRKKENQESNVDLFVLDNAFDNKIKLRIKLLFIKTLQGMQKDVFNYRKYSLLNRIRILLTRIMGKFFSKKWKQRKYAVVSKWGNNQNSAFAGVFNAEYKYLNFLLPKESVSDYVDCAFEDKNLMIFKGYDKILRILYGDYMTPPPLDQRVPKH